MKRRPNPFRPGFGSSPPKLVESDHHLEQFSDALDNGPGSYGRALLLVGQRGTGKTVTLNALEDIAGPKGWLVISETATKGLITRITEDRLPRLLRDHDPRPTSSRILNVSFPLSGGGGGREVRDKHTPVPSLRSQLEDLTEILRERDSGVLITLDEIHKGVYDELEALTTTIQHAVRERRQVAFAAAGLPGSMTALLQVKDEKDPSPLTFLRRSVRVNLENELSDAETARALRDPIHAAGRTITDDALAMAIVESHGYPYMVQLVGYHAWRAAPPEADALATEHVEAAVGASLSDLRRQVLDEALKPLVENDRRYLAAMAKDEGEVSSTRAVADRLGIAPDNANNFRERLIDYALLDGAVRGQVKWDVPMLADYVRDLCSTPEGADAWIRTGRTSHASSRASREAEDLGDLAPKIQQLREQRTRQAPSPPAIAPASQHDEQNRSPTEPPPADPLGR